MSRFDRFQFEYDTVIVGSTLSALLYAYHCRIPFVSAGLEKPDAYDWFLEDLDISYYNLPNGCPKYYLWDRLYFELGLLGLNLSGDLGKSVRIQDDVVKVLTHHARMGRFGYKKLLIFSEKNVEGLPMPAHTIEPMYKVIDYFNVSADKNEIKEMGEPKHLHEFEESALVKYLIIDKPAVAISYCTEQQLITWEYSEAQVKFKILHMLREAGFKGQRNGFNPKRKDGISRYALKVEHLKREENKITRNHTYPNTDKIQFKYDSEIDLLKFFSQ